MYIKAYSYLRNRAIFAVALFVRMMYNTKYQAKRGESCWQKKNNNDTDTCVLTLPLRVEKWQEDCLLKRFEAARRIYNSLLNFELKKLRQLERTVEYRQIQSVISSAYRSNTKDSPEARMLLNAERSLLMKTALANMVSKAMSNSFINILTVLSDQVLPFTALRFSFGLHSINTCAGTERRFISNALGTFLHLKDTLCAARAVDAK